MGKNRTPQDNSYNYAKIYSILEIILYTISFSFSIFQQYTKLIPDNYFLMFTGIILIMLFVFNRLKRQSLDEANNARRRFFLDNAFNNKKLPHKNGKYFDNEELRGGIKKALANLHENSLFTSRITEKMSIRYGIFSGIIALVFLVSTFLNGLNETNSIILSFLLSGGIIIQTIDYKALKNESFKIYLEANAICDQYNRTEKLSLYNSEIIDLLMKYEVSICENNTILSNCIYNRLNSSITKEWNDLKSNYKIYN